MNVVMIARTFYYGDNKAAAATLTSGVDIYTLLELGQVRGSFKKNKYAVKNYFIPDFSCFKIELSAAVKFGGISISAVRLTDRHLRE